MPKVQYVRVYARESRDRLAAYARFGGLEETASTATEGKYDHEHLRGDDSGRHEKPNVAQQELQESHAEPHAEPQAEPQAEEIINENRRFINPPNEGKKLEHDGSSFAGVIEAPADHKELPKSNEQLSVVLQNSNINPEADDRSQDNLRGLLGVLAAPAEVPAEVLVAPVEAPA